MIRPFAVSTQHHADTLRVATYNIHKGVRGVGPRKRLEIHNLGLGIEALDADLVFLQEVRSMNHAEARRFPNALSAGRSVPQADFLAPEGYDVAYRTNAVTRHGEHGNALLSRWPLRRHRPPRRLRPPLRAARPAARARCNGTAARCTPIVVHLGLIHGSRVRQVQRLASFIARAGAAATSC